MGAGIDDLAAKRKLTDATNGTPWHMREPTHVGGVTHVEQVVKQEIHNHFESGITPADLEAAMEGARSALEAFKADQAAAAAAAAATAAAKENAQVEEAEVSMTTEVKLEPTPEPTLEPTPEPTDEAVAAKLTREEPGYWTCVKVVFFLNPIGRFLAPVGRQIAFVW